MRAAIYCRKSTEQERGETGDSLSVEEQVANATAFIRQQGWTLGPVFKDEATSGWKIPIEERDGGKRLIAAVKAKPRSFDALVIRNETRLGREMSDNLAFKMLCHRAGIRMYRYSDGQEIRVGKAIEKAMAVLSDLSGEQESETRSEDVKRHRAERFQKYAAWASSRAPFGYRNERRETYGVLVVDVEKAQTVRRIYEWAARGDSFRRIRDRLTAEGIPGPRGKWESWTVRKLLANRTYTGQTRLNGATKHHEGLRIVSDTLFEQAQRIIAKNAARYAGVRDAKGRLHSGVEGRVSAQYLFSGMLACGVCEAKLWLIPTRGKIYGYCATHQKYGSCSNTRGVPYAALTESILSEIAHIKPERVRALYVAELERVQDTRSALETQTEAARRTLADLERKVERLLDALEADESVKDRLAVRRKEIEAQRGVLAALEARQTATADVDWSAWGQDVAHLVDRLRRPAPHELPAARRALKTLFPEPIRVYPPRPDPMAPGWRWSAQVDWESNTWRQIVMNAESWLPADYDESELERAGWVPVSNHLVRHRNPALPQLGLRVTLEGFLAS